MNITYLLGAGASCKALPTVKGIPKALNDFANDFNPGDNLATIKADDFYNENRDNIANLFLNEFKDNDANLDKYFKKIKALHNDILWLKSESENHTSIDTFAKKLYLRNDFSNLKKLKIILSCFFLYLQTKDFDKRYDSYFASVLEDLFNLPGNLKILSWNYDSQLEIGFCKFSNQTIDAAKRTLNLHSRGDMIYDAYSTNQFCVYKINGTTNIRKGEFNVEDVLIDFDIDEKKLMSSLLDLFDELKNTNNDSVMSFAWENFNKEKGFFPNLIKSISETEIFIVIGYSFPFLIEKLTSIFYQGCLN